VVEQLQGIPLFGVMACGDDDRRRLFFRDGNLRRGVVAIPMSVTSQPIPISVPGNDPMYHLSGDTGVTAYHNSWPFSGDAF